MKTEIILDAKDLSSRLRYGKEGNLPHIDLSDFNMLLQKASITGGSLTLQIEGK